MKYITLYDLIQQLKDQATTIEKQDGITPDKVLITVSSDEEGNCITPMGVGFGVGVFNRPVTISGYTFTDGEDIELDRKKWAEQVNAEINETAYLTIYPE